MSLDKPCPCGEDGPHGQHREDCPNRTHHLATCALMAGITRQHGCTCGLQARQRAEVKTSVPLTRLPEDQINARIQRAQEELAELNGEIARRKSLTPGQILADALHDLLHHRVDCDYYYSDWPRATGCRSTFLSYANAWLEADTLEVLLAIIRRFKSLRDK